ncbi:MAG: hypothetical protein GXP27_02885 [Planctomycetes bacterium]|nr:hypothetical protein [Planctomycetota bacterium]
MGVYHFMGLGRSVGAVTGPLSYLAMRFERWNDQDREFFSLSGEIAQREAGEKVGDVQALVLFTTPEVYSGQKDGKIFAASEYIDNQEGMCPTAAPPRPAGCTRDELRRYLPPIWKRLAKGRPRVDLFWCEVDRTDLLGTFRRAVRVVLAAKSAGSLGKEIWVNLTGGNNVINIALQLAVELTGQAARFYYVQAENPTAEKCLRFAREDGYWVDLPLLPVRAHEASRRVVELLEREGPADIPTLFTKAREQLWQHLQDFPNPKAFETLLVRPLVQQGMLDYGSEGIQIGRRWPLMKPYYETIDQIRRPVPKLNDLDESWFHREGLELR